MNREAIYSAVFSRLQTVAGFTTVSRRVKHWADVPRAEMPYVAMVQRREEAEGSRRGIPLRWNMLVDLYVYAFTPDPNVSPCTILNPLLDGVCDAFLPDVPTSTITLAGLVYQCRINGAIETDEGTLGELAVALIPLSIVTPE